MTSYNLAPVPAGEVNQVMRKGRPRSFQACRRPRSVAHANRSLAQPPSEQLVGRMEGFLEQLGATEAAVLLRPLNSDVGPMAPFTMPAWHFSSAGLREGDRFWVEVSVRGDITSARIVADRTSGPPLPSIRSEGYLTPEQLEELSDHQV